MITSKTVIRHWMKTVGTSLFVAEGAYFLLCLYVSSVTAASLPSVLHQFMYPFTFWMCGLAVTLTIGWYVAQGWRLLFLADAFTDRVSIMTIVVAMWLGLCFASILALGAVMDSMIGAV